MEGRKDDVFVCERDTEEGQCLQRRKQRVIKYNIYI